MWSDIRMTVVLVGCSAPLGRICVPPFKAIGWRYGWGLESNLETVTVFFTCWSSSRIG